MSGPGHVELVEQLFHEALERDAADRAVFLAEACGGDVAVLAEVASLLTSYDRDREFLQRPAFKLSASEVAGMVLSGGQGDLPETPHVPGYEFIREVGRGGMGAVYEALRADGEFRQRVAVKLVKRGMDTDFILRRFDRERRILGALEHQNIARLLDGGTTDEGLPYFVMEYVEGCPVDRYVSETSLPVAGRLRLFLTICEAVSYAHRHRVVHRDLKPSNILVTDAGVPKLLDFGVAKLVDMDSEGMLGDATATIHRVMTPEFASPEQLRGLPPTETSDVYSLGVLLYLLLTGARPYRFRGRAPAEVLRAIDAGPARRPSEALVDFPGPADEVNGLRRELRGSLDKVVLKAMRREPERRYASVAQLAEDIRRHLAGLPVTARDDSLAYRARWLVGRHRVYAASVATVGMLCLLLGLVLGLSSARHERRTSLAVMPFAGGGEGSFTEQLAEGITDGLVERLARLPQLSVPSHNSVFSYKGRQMTPKAVGQSLGVETLLVGSLSMDGESLRVRVELLDAGSGEAAWGRTYDAKPSEILSLQGRIISDVTRVMGVSPSAEEWRQSTRQFTRDEEAYRLYLTGRYFFNKRKKEDYHKGIEYFRQAAERDPAYALAHAGMADSYGMLGAYMIMNPHEAFNSARGAANRALELDEGLAEAHTSLALVHWLYDWDWAAADREFRRAVELKPGYVIAHHWRGLFLGEMGRFEEAVAEMQQALERDPVSAPVYADYGRVLFWARRYDEALEKYRKAEEINDDFGALSVESEGLYEQMGRLDLWEASLDRFNGFDAETRRALREHGLRGFYQVQYRRQLGRDGGLYYAETAARVGEKDRAFEQLEVALREHDHRMTQLKVNPFLDPLRSDPRFGELLRRMNLTP